MNPDPDVCRSLQKYGFIYLVDMVSHFANFRKNWAVTERVVIIRSLNVEKCTILECLCSQSAPLVCVIFSVLKFLTALIY